MSTRRAAHAGDNVHCRVGVAGSPQAGGLPVRAQWAPQLMKSRHLLAKEEPGSSEVVCRCFCRGNPHHLCPWAPESCQAARLWGGQRLGVCLRPGSEVMRPFRTHESQQRRRAPVPAVQQPCEAGASPRVPEACGPGGCGAFRHEALGAGSPRPPVARGAAAGGECLTPGRWGLRQDPGW